MPQLDSLRIDLEEWKCVAYTGIQEKKECVPVIFAPEIYK